VNELIAWRILFLVVAAGCFITSYYKLRVEKDGFGIVTIALGLFLIYISSTITEQMVGL
jgi:hypothetical protein